MYIINKLTHKTKQEHACCKAIVFKENQSTKHRTLFTELALNEAKCEEKKGKEKNASPWTMFRIKPVEWQERQNIRINTDI